MVMTDPIADMLTRVRNANSAYHDQTQMPYSKLKANVADLLKAEATSPPGRSPTRGGQDAHDQAEVRPQPGALDRGLRRISKPGLRVYAKSTNLPRVLGGLGVAILSTSSGLMTDKQAKQKGVGGEVLAYVW